MMDKWEQVAHAINRRIKTCDKAHDGLPCVHCEESGGVCENEAAISDALRQCEADTIRRCAGVADAIAEEARTTAPWGMHNGGSHLAQFARGASASSAAILALLPQESAQ